MPDTGSPGHFWRRRIGSVALSVGVLLSSGLAAVPASADAGAVDFLAVEPVVVLVNGTSLSDVGTAASLVASYVADAVVYAESRTSLGEGAVGVITQQQPEQVVLVGGTAALAEQVEAELRELVSGVRLERLAGRDRIHTAALAARFTLGGRVGATVVLANGWSLSDVGTAAAAVAAGSADAVLYTQHRALGQPTRLVLGSHRPRQVLIVGGTEAIADGLELVISDEAFGAEVVRLGGETRLDTAALFAQESLRSGADTAVIADGWSNDDVGIAATLAAAVRNSAIIYTDGEALTADARRLLHDHAPRRVLVVNSRPDDRELQIDISDTVPQAELGAIESAASAAHYVLGTVPPGPTDAGFGNYIALAAGGDATCAISDDRTIACWGRSFRTFADVPDGRYAAVAVGEAHSCGLREDQTLVCWGRQDLGLLDAPDGRFTRLAAGRSSSCAIRVDRTLACWGSEEDFGPADTPRDLFVDIAAGASHMCAIRTNGTMACWGHNSAGQTDALSGRYRDVSAGAYQTCAIRVDRSLTCWGDYGKALSPDGKFSDIAVNDHHACAVRTDNSILCWGDEHSGRLDASGDDNQFVAAGTRHTCVIKTNGSITCWGNNGFGEAVVPKGHFGAFAVAGFSSCAIQVDRQLTCWGNDMYKQRRAPSGEFAYVATSTFHSCGMRTDRRAVCWGSNHFGQLDAPDDRFTELATGVHHSCGITTAGSVTCWGSNDSQQTDAPTGEFSSITASANHSCALRTDRAVVCWGSQTLDRLEPYASPEGQFTAISIGPFRTCGIRDDDTISCWDDNQALPGSPVGRFRSVSAGVSHSCGIRFDYQVICWGSNLYGQTDPPEGRFVAVAAGGTHSCAIRTGRTAVCWSWTTNLPPRVELVF